MMNFNHTTVIYKCNNEHNEGTNELLNKFKALKHYFKTYTHILYSENYLET
jgi:hypothetical protein